MENRFEGKVVSIPGAASGIGAATARRLAAEGARAMLVDCDADGLATSGHPNFTRAIESAVDA